MFMFETFFGVFSSYIFKAYPYHLVLLFADLMFVLRSLKCLLFCSHFSCVLLKNFIPAAAGVLISAMVHIFYKFGSVYFGLCLYTLLFFRIDGQHGVACRRLDKPTLNSRFHSCQNFWQYILSLTPLNQMWKIQPVSFDTGYCLSSKIFSIPHNFILIVMKLSVLDSFQHLSTASVVICQVIIVSHV
jgi:hypothetical protein